MKPNQFKMTLDRERVLTVSPSSLARFKAETGLDFFRGEAPQTLPHFIAFARALAAEDDSSVSVESIANALTLGKVQELSEKLLICVENMRHPPAHTMRN